EPRLREPCFVEVEATVHDIARETAHAGDQTIDALRALFSGLRAIEGAKTLVLISEGFALTDSPAVFDLGNLAAASRTSVYALRLQTSWFDVTLAQPSRDPFNDRRTQNEGLEQLVGVARGALFEVIGKPEGLFDRLGSELSGYYLLGVESDPKDR